MVKFLFKGLIADKGRSLLPIIVIAIGTLLTVFLHSWLSGVLGESVKMSSSFYGGDVKVVTKVYLSESDLFPNDLAITESSNLLEELRGEMPQVVWSERIRFGALADFPDTLGETRGQTPITGWAVDLLSNSTKEIERLNLENAIITGSLPKNSGEILISHEMAKRFNVSPGEQLTIFGTTMEGGMAFYNMRVCGTILFGSRVLDRGAVIMDITDARRAFAMEDASSEILGFLPFSYYNPSAATEIKERFNKKQEALSSSDEFSPTMITLKDQAGMAEMIQYADAIGGIMVTIFVLAMAIVLWNSGLIAGLKRYSEFGIRLAMGEDKLHIYKSLLIEALIVGFVGSAIGTSIGIIVVVYINIHGVDISSMMQNATMIMPSVVRTSVTPVTYYIGFIPGIASVLIGNALAGVGIFRRETARLFNELEV